jgi:hypothetical protein
MAWLHPFVAFFTSKHRVAAELLTSSPDGRMFFESRDRVIAAGRPLLSAAQQSREIREDITLEQILDMIAAIARIDGEPRYLQPIAQTALDGSRPPISQARSRLPRPTSSNASADPSAAPSSSSSWKTTSTSTTRPPLPPFTPPSGG